MKHSKQVKHPICCKWMPQEIALEQGHISALDRDIRTCSDRDCHIGLSEGGGSLIDPAIATTLRSPGRSDRSPVAVPGPFLPASTLRSPRFIDPAAPFPALSHRQESLSGRDPDQVSRRDPFRQEVFLSARSKDGLFEANPRTRSDCVAGELPSAAGSCQEVDNW